MLPPSAPPPAVWGRPLLLLAPLLAHRWLHCHVEGDSNIMNLDADLQVVTVDASTACILRFWANYVSLNAMINRVTGTMAKVTYPNTEKGCAHSQGHRHSGLGEAHAG